MSLPLNGNNKFKDVILLCILSHPLQKFENRDNLYQTFVRNFLVSHILSYRQFLSFFIFPLMVVPVNSYIILLRLEKLNN